MRFALFIPLALLTAVHVARADVVDIKWSGNGRFAHEGTVAAGKFAEAGTSTRWDFEASLPLDSNVHHHVGKEVVFPSKLAAVTRAKDTLQTRIAQDYCWMWSNKSSRPATTLNLQRG